MAKIIGLTGGIGSGKSTIARHIESLGIPVYIADAEARKILSRQSTADKIASVFGKDILDNGTVDRVKLSRLVFRHPEKLAVLNSIVHPEVALDFKSWVEKNKSQPIVVKEAAILFESGSYRDCDKIILVTAPEEARIQRVMSRDGLSRREILDRMANQWSEEEKEVLSDYVILNDDLKKACQTAENIISILTNR
ncbi:MAG TPA: dephospho-CoA kinase [Flavobacterium sp.]|nr:dephospho-CoA kinase [Flavobacterium sp.]